MSKRLLTALSLGIIVVLFTAGCGAEKAEITEAGPEAEFRVFAEGIPGCDGVAMDRQGNLYVGSRANNELYRVDKGGKVSAFAAMPCSELLCMTVGADGALYAAGRDSLLKVTGDGQTRVLMTGFNCADDLRVDPNGVIYLADASDNIVYRITPDMKRTVFVPSDIPQGNLGKWEITGVAFDPSYRYLYIARMNRGVIMRYPINPDGTAGRPETIAKGLAGCDHLEMDTEGRLYVTLFNSGSLIAIDRDGRRETIVDGGFTRPTGIVFGRSGFGEQSVFVADYFEGKVYEVPVGAVVM